MKKRSSSLSIALVRRHRLSILNVALALLCCIPCYCRAWMMNPKSPLEISTEYISTLNSPVSHSKRERFQLRLSKCEHLSLEDDDDEGHLEWVSSLSNGIMDRRVMLALLPSMTILIRSDVANGFPFFPAEERIQLELCLVSILRVRYWAEKTGKSIKEMLEIERTSGLSDRQKGPYLEARLGAKAAITGKIGGGANTQVLVLAKLKIKECIQDAMWSYKEMNKTINKGELRKLMSALDGYGIDILESLANIVEFDGLETTQDPSPRSSLALSMYNSNKAVFIQRMLLERTVSSCDAFVNSFGREKRDYCETYIRLTYPSEIPLEKIPVTSQLDEK